MLRSSLCDYSDAYLVVKGTITVTNPDNPKRNKAAAFKNNAPFIFYILEKSKETILEFAKETTKVL